MRRALRCLAVALAAGLLTAPAAHAGIRLSSARAERVGGADLVLTGKRFAVRGAVRPVVAGQEVVVRLYRDGRKVRARRVHLDPAGGVWLPSVRDGRQQLGGPAFRAPGFQGG